MQAPPHAVLGPRRPPRPMAFPGHELWRGAFITWGVLAVLLLLLDVILGWGTGNIIGWLGTTFHVLLFALTIAAVATVIGTGFAFLVGTALQRVRAWPVHVIAHGLVAAAVGVLTIVAVVFVVFGPSRDWSDPTASAVLSAFAAGSALAAVVGWVWTSRIALREDAAYDSVQREAGLDARSEP